MLYILILEPFPISPFPIWIWFTKKKKINRFCKKEIYKIIYLAKWEISLFSKLRNPQVSGLNEINYKRFDYKL